MSPEVDVRLDASGVPMVRLHVVNARGTEEGFYEWVTQPRLGHRLGWYLRKGGFLVRFVHPVTGRITTLDV